MFWSTLEGMGFLESNWKPLALEEHTFKILEYVHLPVEVAIRHVKGPQKTDVFEARGNHQQVKLPNMLLLNHWEHNLHSYLLVIYQRDPVTTEKKEIKH